MEYHTHQITTACVMLTCVVPIGAVIFLFSAMGFGAKLHGSLAHNDLAWALLFGSGFAMGFTLYLLDVTRWKDDHALNALKHIMFLYIMISWAIGFVLCATNMPDANLVLCMLGLPSFFYAIKEWKYYHVDLATYLHLMGCSLLASGVLAVVIWLMWVNGVLFWDEAHTWKGQKVYLASEMCPIIDGERERQCVAVYLAYFYPLFVGTATMLFGSVTILLKIALSQKHCDSSEGKLEMTVKIALIMFLVGVFGIWVATGIAAAGVTLSNSISLISLVLMAELSLFVTGVLGMEHVKAQLMAIPLFKSMASTAESDWLKALIFITAFPFLAIYIAVNFMRQCCFLYLFGVVQKLTLRPRSEAPGILPNATTKMLGNMRNWQWSSVLVKMCYLSIFYFTCIIGVGRITTVFFSWLNEQLSTMEYIPMVSLFIAFGVSLFLLPPVPGVPVYIIGGITVVEAGEDDFGGFVPSVIVCVLICLFIKLSAVAMQQKMIGEKLSDSVTVRALVGVNDIQIRAVRHILMRPGLNLAKVCIHPLILSSSLLSSSLLSSSLLSPRIQGLHSLRRPRLAHLSAHGYPAPATERDAHWHHANHLPHHAVCHHGRVTGQGRQGGRYVGDTWPDNAWCVDYFAVDLNGLGRILRRKGSRRAPRGACRHPAGCRRRRAEQKECCCSSNV
jgi:hypothetical protein